MEILKNLFFILICIFFFYVNFKIIYIDIKEKIIPNKSLFHLLLLIPFYYISIYLFTPSFISSEGITLGVFILQLMVTLLVGFGLYSFGIWGAGDAKYIIILGFFIPQIGIIPFIGNIAILVIFYLLAYFIWFYFGKCIFKKGYAKWIYQGVKKDLLDKLSIFLKTNNTTEINKKNIFLKILKWFVFFLIIFVTIRLIRLYIYEDIKDSNLYEYLYSSLDNYSYYLIGGGIVLFFGCTFLIRYCFNKCKNYILSKTNGKSILLGEIIFLMILSIALVSFILYEYHIKNAEISEYLKRIFTFYIFIYLIFKILKYSYYITFQVNEQNYIIIKLLKAGDIVDKEYLIKTFGDQDCLGGSGNNGILSPNPKEYFSRIENPIDEETKDKLIEIYKIVNTYHLVEKKDSTTRITDIKILKTFALGGYIFFGFCITLIFGNTLFEKIFGYFFSFIFPH